MTLAWHFTFRTHLEMNINVITAGFYQAAWQLGLEASFYAGNLCRGAVLAVLIVVKSPTFLAQAGTLQTAQSRVGSLQLPAGRGETLPGSNTVKINQVSFLGVFEVDLINYNITEI